MLGRSARLPLHLLTLVCLAFPSGAWSSECAETFSALQFEDQLGAAESALTGLNLTQFRLNLERADLMIPCLDERLLPSLAATYHRFYGLRAFGDRDDAMADKAFAAARYLEPAYVFSRALIPEGNPVREAFEDVSFEERPIELLDAAAAGAIYFDGLRSLRRSSGWPTVMQWVEGDTVHFSTYLMPGEAVPTYPLASGTQVTKRDPSIPLVAVSGGAAAVAAGLYGVAMVNQGRYKQLDDPVPDSKLPGLRRTTNGLVVASGVSALASVGTGLAVVATW